jgi:hypothetical protein
VRYRRKARLRRVRWGGRDRDVDHALRVAARFDRRKRWRERPASLARSIGAAGLIFGFAFALAMQIDVPHMIAAGFPNAEWGPAVARDVFGGKVADWPTLSQPLLVIAAAVALLIGLAGTMLARRQAGAVHMLRAIVGVGVLLLALLPIGAVFYSVKPWEQVAMLPMSERSAWLVVRILLEHANLKVILGPLIVAAFGAFLLALPPRRQSAPASSAAAPASAGNVSGMTTNTSLNQPAASPVTAAAPQGAQQ